MKRLILSREDRDNILQIVIQLMDLVLIEEPPIYFVEKNRDGRTGQFTLDEATAILEEALS